MHETRLSLKEAIRMKGVAQLQQDVVEVVTHFVHQGTEKRLELYNLPSLRGQHPHLNAVFATRSGREQPMQLTGAVQWPRPPHFYVGEADSQRPAQLVTDDLRQLLRPLNLRSTTYLLARRMHQGTFQQLDRSA
jgi:hypothetical protein